MKTALKFFFERTLYSEHVDSSPTRTALRAALAPASMIYGALLAARNGLYDHGLIAIRRANIPIVSVGSLTIGGAGKTPMTRLIVQIARSIGARPVVLSRGYGIKIDGALIVADRNGLRIDPAEAPDEALIFAADATPVVCAPERTLGAQLIENELDADLIVLDDGFQHRRLARDLDICLIDRAALSGASAPLFPAGPARESPRALKRADMIVALGVGPSTDRFSHAELAWLRRYAPNAKLIGALGAIESFEPLRAAQRVEPPSTAILLSAIANPNRFADSVRAMGMEIVDRIVYGDHHRYSRGDLARALDLASRKGAPIITTEKDAVKLAPLLTKDEERSAIFIARHRLTPTINRSALIGALENLLTSARASTR